MAKSLLLTLLMLTQSLAGASSPLYLCIEGNGGFCVDYGPAACDCCRHDDEHGHASEGLLAQGDCAELEHCIDLNLSDGHDAACDCVHVCLSNPLAAVVTARVALPDAAQGKMLPAAIGSNLGHLNVVILAMSPTLITHVASTSALAQRASLVLRC